MRFILLLFLNCDDVLFAIVRKYRVLSIEQNFPNGQRIVGECALNTVFYSSGRGAVSSKTVGIKFFSTLSLLLFCTHNFFFGIPCNGAVTVSRYDYTLPAVPLSG